MAATPRLIEDPKEYRFDLAVEARNILRDYPQLDGHTVFVSADAPADIVGSMRDLPQSYRKIMPGHVANYIERALNKKTSMAYAEQVQDGMTGTSFPVNVVVLLPTPPKDIAEAHERDFRDHFILNHEAGHLLLPYTPESRLPRYPYSECLADAFATIRSMQKFGADDAIHNKLSATRALGFMLSGNSNHLTTTVTDRILDEAKRQDFSALGFDETLTAAHLYAKALTPRIEELEQAEESYARIADYMRANPAADKLEIFGLVGQTCLATSDKFSFFLGAKFFQPFLNPDGMMLAQNGIILAPEQRLLLVDTFIEKSRGFRLDTLAAQFMENRVDVVPEISPAFPLRRVAAVQLKTRSKP